MRRRYQELTHYYRRAHYAERSEAVVWVVSVGWRPVSVRADGVCEPRLWYEVWRGERGNSGELAAWQLFAQTLARAWNAILLGAELLNRSLNMPPAVMADELEDQREIRLAKQLRIYYAPEIYGAPVPRPSDQMPGLPAGAPDHSCLIV